MRPKIISISNFLQSQVLSSEEMSSALAVISDCDGIPGQHSCCTLCKQPLRVTQSHPGEWKSELQQFILNYSEIPRSSCVPVMLASDGDCVANTKENLDLINKVLLCTRLWQNL